MVEKPRASLWAGGRGVDHKMAAAAQMCRVLGSNAHNSKYAGLASTACPSDWNAKGRAVEFCGAGCTFTAQSVRLKRLRKGREGKRDV